MQKAYGCSVQTGLFLFASLTNDEVLAPRPKPRYQIVIARFALKAFRSMQTFAATNSKKELTSWGALERRQATVRRLCAQERLRKVNFCETEPPGQTEGRRWGGMPYALRLAEESLCLPLSKWNGADCRWRLRRTRAPSMERRLFEWCS